MSPPAQSDSSIPDMTTSTKAMMAKVKQLVPPMLEKFHKGQLGRVAVIGGSAEYTGAPYFSAMASARLGCDLSYVICEPSAAQTIKSYSPNLMVSPLLRSTKSLAMSQFDPSIEEMTSPILALLPRLHVLVIGPGLGRDDITLKQVAAIIKAARSHDPPVPLVLDADGLFLINSDPDLIKGYKECILTPNVIEFARIAKGVGVSLDEGDRNKDCENLAKALGGVCIIQKGKVDHISTGEGTTTCDFEGGLKRSGGQGDTLTGSLGTFLAWRQAYHEGLWESANKMSREETLLAAAFAGSAITRECSRKAFKKNGRSLQASDLTDEVHGSFLSLIGEPEGDSKL
ncbi:hypothetical protein GJ744_003586 [Endocarpon pusillum]|uniref:ATP-dependent (S)-NAD(P)H-hydrate dehydratase n=1 Tax=Endocarpon pusillum TaxID=364733 RepID=A0A8H7A7P0_9EURO|nr:hypothetical protein GJ744_003586 [Endocarpon pusillum]